MSIFSRKATLVAFCMAVILLWPSAFSSCADKRETVDWQIIKKTFDEYLEYPSTENAAQLCAVLPKENVKNISENHGVFEYLYQNYETLAYEMKCGDRNAVTAAFRLFNISDGAFTEEIEWSLAELIRIQPKLFLEELELHKNEYFMREVNYPLYGEGSFFVDRMNAQLLETEMRIKALESVSDEGLRPIRDECIKRLTDHLKRDR